MSDELRDLVHHAQAGDRDARNDLLQRHLPSLRAFIRLQLGHGVRSRESSLDLVQSVCREVLEGFDGFEYRGPDSFRNWLLKSAQNKIRDRGRYWGRERRTAQREAGSVGQLLNEDDDRELLGQLKTFCTPSRHATAREELERAEQVFQQLPPAHREVIVLARVLGLPHPDVAREMGRTPVATRTLLSRALARMATLLEEAEAGSGEGPGRPPGGNPDSP
jgi:RNA polymerase sigma factor (sigma-70 family)